MGKILVIRGGAIGDFILTLPAIRLLKEELPQARIEVMGYQPIIALAKAGGYAAQTRSIEYGAMASFFAKDGALDETLCAYFSSFSVVVSYLYDPDHHFRHNLERAGVQTLIECSHRVDSEGEAASRQLAKPLESLALFLDDARAGPELRFDGEAEVEAKAFLGDNGAGGRLVAIHPGSGSPYKNWALERWRDVMHRLLEYDADCQFLVSTGEAEEASVAAFLDSLRADSLPVRFAERLPLPVLGAAFSGCSLYLGHDSGISHLAAAVGTPSVVLFGPTESSVWAPPHPHVTVLEHRSHLLREITVQDVFEAALARFSD